MKATVTVMLKNGVLDPQGKAIAHALGTLGFSGVSDVRAGIGCLGYLDARDPVVCPFDGDHGLPADGNGRAGHDAGAHPRLNAHDARRASSDVTDDRQPDRGFSGRGRDVR